MSSVISTTPDQDTQLRAKIDRSLRHPVMFFLTSGAAWLAVSIVLGVIASAKIHNPDFLGDLGVLTYGRIFPAHVNALIYGWGMQAAFAVIIWLMARLSGKECTAGGIILTAGHVWNLGVMLGVIGILTGNGTGMPWMEFPSFAWPVLLSSYLAIVIWSFIQFRVRLENKAHISQWYILAAMIWFPWIFITCNTLLHCIPGHPVMAAGINAWFRSGLTFLFFTPVALGAAYYLAPKVTGRPVFSCQLAKLGFWSLAVIAPWAGMQKLAGAPIPYFLPYVGAAATALLFIPACAAAINTLRTIFSSGETLAASPTLRFTAAGIVGLVLLGIASVFLSLPDSTLKVAQFSLSGYGYDMLALYGFFSLVMFGAIYFIVPRVTCCEWLSRRLIKIHFLFSVYGVFFIAVIALYGGLQQGMAQEQWKQSWMAAVATAVPYAVVVTFSWCLILFANSFFFIHLVLMWLRLGRRSGLPTLLAGPRNEENGSDSPNPEHAAAQG